MTDLESWAYEISYPRGVLGGHATAFPRFPAAHIKLFGVREDNDKA